MTQAPEPLKLPHGVLDLNAGEVRTTDGCHVLNEREVQLLSCLAEQPGEAVSRRTLLLRLGLEESSSNALKTWIWRLRKKIEPDPKKPTVLLRFYGGSFMLKLHDASTVDRKPEVQEAPLMGRVEALETLQSLLIQGHRMLTLVGPAGVGKTRLARAVVEQPAGVGHTARGVVYCELAACKGPLDFIHTVARSTNVSLGASKTLQDVLQALGAALSQRGRLFFVLDNLEHLVSEVREPLSALYRLAPNVQWLLTSRHRLGLDAEQVVPVETLTPQAGAALLRHRVEALGGVVPAGSEDELLGLSEALEGSPLAILMAAARLAMGSWVEEMRSLSTSLTGLMDSLQSTLLWSWNLLEDVEREALAQCRLFRGGFTMDLAEEVVAVEGYWTDDLLMALVDHSLVWLRQEDQGPRLYLYESVRSFVHNQFPDVDEGLGSRFVQAFAALNEGGRGSLGSMEEEFVRTARLEGEVSNLWVAQELARSRAGEASRWVLGAWHWILERQGRVLELKDELNLWLEDDAVKGGIRRDVERFWVLQCRHLRDLESPRSLIARLEAVSKGDLSDGEYLETQRPVLEFYFRTMGKDELVLWIEDLLSRVPHAPPLDRAWVQYLLGIAYRRVGRVEEGIEIQRRVLETPGYANWKMSARSSLAVGLAYIGRIGEAVSRFEEVYAWHKRYGGTLAQMGAAANLGRVCLLDGQYNRAWEVLQQGWEIGRAQTPTGTSEICGMNYLGACLILGKEALAEEVLTQTIARAESMNNIHSLALLKTLRGALGALRGDMAGFEEDWQPGIAHMVTFSLLSEEEFAALAECYRTLIRADKEGWSAACVFVCEVLERPYIRLKKDGEAPRKGSTDHQLHVMILQEWMRRVKG